MTSWRLPLLLVVLAGLLIWLWISDRASPSYPYGQFFPVVSEAALVVLMVTGVIQLWQVLRRLNWSIKMKNAISKNDEAMPRQELTTPNQSSPTPAMSDASIREGLPPQVAPAWNEGDLTLPESGYGQHVTAQPRSHQHPDSGISQLREGLPPPLGNEPTFLDANAVEPPAWAVQYVARHFTEGSKAIDIEEALIRQGLPRKLAISAIERWFHQVFAKENQAARMASRRWFWSVVLTFVAGGVAFLGALLLGDQWPPRWRLGLAFVGVGCFIGGYVLFRIGWSLTAGERDFREMWRNVTRPRS